MSLYVAPHLKPCKNTKDPKEKFSETLDDFKLTSNSPYGKIESLESLSAAKTLSFKTPTVIQKYAIPVLLNNHSLLCKAPTGLGKTLCFLLPLIENIKIPYGLKIAIVAPTRELCQQIKDEAQKISGKLVVECAYGGMKTNGISRYTNILVAAPGRLTYLLQNNMVNFGGLAHFVLDEADKLLEMGFEREIRYIKSCVPCSTIVSLFSATYYKHLDEIINDFLPPNRVIVEVQNETVKNIKQTFVQATNKNKKLQEILSERVTKVDKVIVFVQRKSAVEELENTIKEWGYAVTSIHGDKEQYDRQLAMDKFKKGTVHILVATSVAARGIDVQDVMLVVNYDFPMDINEYIHRIGRTGRKGNNGNALSFVGNDISPELKKSIVDVLRESDNEIPDFLLQNTMRRTDAYNSKTTVRGGWTKTPQRKTSYKREIVEDMKALDIKESKGTEKADSVDDLPGVW